MKRVTLFLFMLLVVSLSAQSTVILHQGFEATQDDNWMYIADPVPNRQTWWGPTDHVLGGADAQSGSWYWGSQNLGDQVHSLTFESAELSKLHSYSLSFYYYSMNMGINDLYRYCVEYDTGSNWKNWVYLQPNTNAWNQVVIELPSYATTFRLRMEAQYSGLYKYQHWDNFCLNAQQIDPSAPYVYNVSAAQRTDGSKLVDIYYDMVDVNLDLASIEILVSTDGGITFDYEPQASNLSGDIGDDIESGSAKHIIWNAGAESIDFVGTDYQIRVLAEDHTAIGTVQTPRYNPMGGVFFELVAVRIHCDTYGAEIHYTVDGSEPTLNSPLYSRPVVLMGNATLRSRAFMEGWIPSEILEAQFQIVLDPPENFVFVPGGTFNMGRTTGEGYGNELPVHPVTLTPFFVCKYEVTQQEYEDTVGSMPSQSGGSGPNKPVHRVSWYDALVYCNVRSMAEGLEPVYAISGTTNPGQWGMVPIGFDQTWNAAICNWNASGYRLLTEAEWEYAARGASNYPDYLYSGSNNPDLVGWYGGNSGGGVHPVGQKQPNALGLYDMSGNVSEFNWDWLGNEYYSTSPIMSPTGPESGVYRLGRGGSWTNTVQGLRVSFRPSAAPQYTHNNIGIRVGRRAGRQSSPRSD